MTALARLDPVSVRASLDMTTPPNWAVRQLGRLGSFLGGAGFPDEYQGDSDQAIPFFKVSDMNHAANLHTMRIAGNTISAATARKLHARICPPGAILFPKVGAALLTNKRRLTDRACVFDNNIMAFVPDAIDPRFACYVLGEIDLGRLSRPGPVPSINASDCKSLRILLPLFAEQRAIANFLDRKTAAIDDLIRAKERLITLLQEKRQALITQAVTKGLDPSVPMKDSGIEWLGEVPAHWDVAPLYSHYHVALGKMLDSSRITGEHLAPYLRNIDVQWDSINVSDLPEMDFRPTATGRYGLRRGDLLVCEGGEVGRTAVWQGELAQCYYQKALHRLRPMYDNASPRFLYYVMFAASKLGVFVSGGNSNTIDHLTAVQLRRHRFPFPPSAEQARISVQLDRETSVIDSLLSAIRDSITKLAEYRQSLISAAVTGMVAVEIKAAKSAST